MKYIAPEYRNEMVLSEDIITTSPIVTETVNQSNPGDVTYGTQANEILGM